MSPVDTQTGEGAAATGVPIELRAVEHGFGAVTVLADIDIAVAPGQFVALLGPSGCGKSTLLRLVAALDVARAGQVCVAGQPVRESVRAAPHPVGDRIAFVFQDPHLLPWRTLLRNVELPLELAGVARAERRERALAVIDEVGLRDAHDRYPAALSGGMRMRASLARALVTDPAVLLLDEPFAALDEITRQRLDEKLYALWRERGMTVLFVTHSIGEAVFLSQRTIMLSRRPAGVVADQTIELPGRAAALAAAASGSDGAAEALALRSSEAFHDHVKRLHGRLMVAEGGR